MSDQTGERFGGAVLLSPPASRPDELDGDEETEMRALSAYTS